MRIFLFLALIAMVIVVMSNVVVAEAVVAFVDSPYTITTACIRNGQLRANASAYITIYDSSGAVIVPQTNETPSGNGTFSFIYTFTVVGGYSTKETCDFLDFLADGSTQINVVKPSFGSMQVIAQGVSTVSLNETAKSEWLLLLPNSTNVSSSSIHVIGGVCEVSGMDGSIINATISTVTTNDKMTATFQSDPAFGFEEGANYQILCNISLTQGLFVNGVKNFIYVNPQKTYWQWLIDAIAQLLGIAQQTSATVNETLSISNQTLQLVKAMNSSGISSVGIRAWTTN